MPIFLALAALAAVGVLLWSQTASPGTSPPKPGELPPSSPVVTDLLAFKVYGLNVFAMKSVVDPIGLSQSIVAAAGGALQNMGKLPTLAKPNVDIGGGVIGNQWIVIMGTNANLKLPFTVPNVPWQIMSAVDVTSTPAL